MNEPDMFGHSSDWFPAISLWQPWASWVAWGWKPIETRTHRRFACLVGRRIAIHAALAWDKRALALAERWLTPEQRAKTADEPNAFPRGAFICTALVNAHGLLSEVDQPGALIECATLRFGLFLDEVKIIETPVRAIGRQGIFSVKLP